MVAQRRGISAYEYISETTVPEFLVEAAATWLAIQAPIALVAEAFFGTGKTDGKKGSKPRGAETTALLPDGKVSKKRPPDWWERGESPPVEWAGKKRPRSTVDKSGATRVWHDLDTPAGDAAFYRVFHPGGMAQRLAAAQSQNLRKAKAKRLG
jgi:hypothetical protein